MATRLTPVASRARLGDTRPDAHCSQPRIAQGHPISSIISFGNSLMVAVSLVPTNSQPPALTPPELTVSFVSAASPLRLLTYFVLAGVPEVLPHARPSSSSFDPELTSLLSGASDPSTLPLTVISTAPHVTSSLPMLKTSPTSNGDPILM